MLYNVQASFLGGWRQGRLRLKIRRPLPQAGSGVFKILTGRVLPDSSNSSVPGTHAPAASISVSTFFHFFPSPNSSQISVSFFFGFFVILELKMEAQIHQKS